MAEFNEYIKIFYINGNTEYYKKKDITIKSNVEEDINRNVMKYFFKFLPYHFLHKIFFCFHFLTLIYQYK